MAAPNSTALPFLIYYAPRNSARRWQVKAVQTSRTISSHQRLDRAIRKAEKLNVDAIAADRPVQCSYEYHWGDCEGMPCYELGTVVDITTELPYCQKHFREVSRG